MLRTVCIVVFFLLALGHQSFAQKEQDVLIYIDLYKDIAMKEMQRTGVPAAIKLAQGIHETEAGTSDLVVKSNNHFGIKCKTSWGGQKVFHDDDARGECFRSYLKAEESYMDHSDFLRNSPRYASLFQLDPTDFEGWANGLRKAGYATNVRYSQILISIIRRYNLQDYSLIALGRMKESDHMLASNSSMLNLRARDSKPAVEEAPKEAIPAPNYPAGPFKINKTKVIYASANTAWLSIAEQHNISLARLWDFNDLESDDDVLEKGQLVYLQLKRKVGSSEFHIVQKGENLYDISQAEGIRYESLLDLNHLNGAKQPVPGEKLNLQFSAFQPPLLINESGNRVSYNKN